MKKGRDANNKKNSFSKRHEDISEIEKKVDRLLLGNKEKLNRVTSNEIDIEKFSLTKNDKKKIYYVKKKKTGANENYDKLSEKIISDARDNLGEEPLKVDESITEIDNRKPKNEVFQKRIKFGKKKPMDETATTFADKYDLKETDKFEMIFESDKNGNEDDTDYKSAESEKKHSYFGKIKNSMFKNKKDKEDVAQIPPYKDSLAEGNVSNKGITETSESEIDIFEEKKSFFGRQKTSKAEEFKGEERQINPDDSGFHAENLPTKEIGEDEAKLLDEKIKKSPMETSEEVKKDNAEVKALELAKEHIKERPEPSKNNELLDDGGEEGTETFLDLSLDEDDEKHEHVFFDETDTDSSFEWSPRIPDKERKRTPLPISGHPNIKSEGLEEIGDIELPKELLRSKSVKLSDLGFSEQEWEELDFYPLHEPFVYVEILREKESLDKCYFLVEVGLTEEEEEIMEFISETMNRLIIDTAELDSKGDEVYLAERLNQVIEEYDVKIKDESKDKIFYYLGKDAFGLGRIDPLLKDPNIEDISCDGSGVPIFLYHRKYGSLKSNVKFASEDELSSFIFKLAQKCGKHISIAEPMLDATMPDGSRVQMTLSDEITAKGSTFTVRKFREDPFSPPDLVEFNTMSSEMIAYLWVAIENGVNTLFAGGTASGKTTTLNAVCLFIPREAKIVSIEETREINLPHPNWIPGVARSGFGEIVADKMVGEIDMYDLMKAALRQRPEYILVGEIRGQEAYVLFQAMATGHATYSTVHADSAKALIHRLEGKPIEIPRIMLQSLDIVSIHITTRVQGKRVRRCKQIIEIIDIDPTTKEILTNEVFRWDPVEDRFVYSGKSYILERIRAEKDLSREVMTQEIKNRKKIVEWMNNNNIREFRDVAKLIAQYTENPDEALKVIEKDVNE